MCAFFFFLNVCARVLSWNKLSEELHLACKWDARVRPYVMLMETRKRLMVCTGISER